MEKKPSKSYTVQEALQKLARYCVYQDRCHQEVEKKLQSMNMIPQARAHIISELIQQDFLNEERFALQFVRGKFNQKGWGRIRLKQELKRRDISEYLINKALNQIKEAEYLEKLENLALKKYKQLGQDQSWYAKSRLKNHLIYKGFEFELVLDEINNLYNF
jgi:regulatory protein